MSVLEWIGIISIALFVFQCLANIYIFRNRYRHSRDPLYHQREFEFNRMARAFDRLKELLETEYDPHNQILTNVLEALSLVVQLPVPMEKDAFASDYRSKYTDYTVIYYLSKSIIDSELQGGKPAKDALKIEW